MSNLRHSQILCSLALILFVGFASGSFQLNDDVLGLIVFKADLVDPNDALRSWNEDDNSPCNWTGVGCDPSNGRVTELYLDSLSLSGHIGRSLAKLEYLKNLSLSHNNLSGSIDGELSQLKQLQVLDLSYNSLSGEVSLALSDMDALTLLDLSHNALSGAIPGSFFTDCKALSSLSLAVNSLEGSIPTSIGLCHNLKQLNLSHNGLNNALPESIADLTQLSVLDVAYNSLNGDLPAFPPSLVTAKLRNNRFSGDVPQQLGNCSQLQHLDLSNNLFSSSIPDSMQSLRALTALNLANNYISGGIPTWISELRSLQVLNLSSNGLVGEMPSSLGQLATLQVADFSLNGLSGEIPSSFTELGQLKLLDMSSNNLTGPVLYTLPPGLLSMALSNNHLSGDVPDTFYDNCGSLEILDLSGNSLHGSLSQLAKCTNLEIVMASHNLFSGQFPAFQKDSAIVVADFSHNELYGSIPSSLGDVSKLSVLFLDQNKLSGLIPPELGNCSSLTDINLSHNNIQGSIPPELGNLTDLQILDLSQNNISGAIPPELGDLQRLVFFNVSYNQLEGPIPDYGNFQRFNQSAFLGNANLCGASVNVTCPNVMPKPIVLNPDSPGLSPSASIPFIAATGRRHIMLSASAILAIAAAAAISAGVVIVFVLNMYAQSTSRLASHSFDSFSESPSSDLPIGKLVMFSKNSDPRSEEWVTSAHALLNKDSELGRGGFGTVYKAVLADGRTVAIKKLMVSSLVKSQYDFEKEIQFLGQIKHRNLLALQGYYWTPQLQLLIYDFIPNGNLYSCLHEKCHSDKVLSWPTRFKIALGTARALAHLHHSCRPQVIHYNMKSSNVLLDEEYNPKIADYGLAKLLPMMDRYLMSSKFQSALGYMAPEFACQSSRINEKCDVYGYGVMLLELVTGRRPVEYMEDDVVILCDYVRSLLDEGTPMCCVDPKVQDYIDDEVLPIIKLGLICTSQVPSNRPSMAEVVQILELIKTPTNSKDLL